MGEEKCRAEVGRVSVWLREGVQGEEKRDCEVWWSGVKAAAGVKKGAGGWLGVSGLEGELQASKM